MKHYFITGANRGIGLELVRQLSALGHPVFACCRQPNEAKELQDLSKKNNIKIISLNLEDLSSIQQLPQFIADEPIDVLLNVAGVMGSPQDLYGTEEMRWIKTFKINAMAPFFISRILLPNLKKGQDKIIVNMSSQMGSIDDNKSGGRYIYRSTKAALNAVTKSLALDLAPEKFKVITFHPGWVKTRMGGENALISVDKSVEGLRQVLDNLSSNQNGQFINYRGEIIPW